MSSHADELCEKLAGQKYAALLQKHLGQLRKVYSHGNRTLFYDELVGAYLLAFFNPTLRSLRTIDDFTVDPSRHPRRLCRSTLSDANALMDARLLEPIIPPGYASEASRT